MSENQREVEVSEEAVEAGIRVASEQLGGISNDSIVRKRVEQVIQAAAPVLCAQERERLEGEHETERLALEANCTELEEERDQAAQQERERVKEALLLLAITHFDHERLLLDESLDATHLFDAGLLQHREIGQTGEYEAALTARGYERLIAALTTLDKETD